MGDEVSPTELLFDLIFVFAISQLSEHLLENLTWTGALETLVLLLAVFGVWANTSFGASMPGISRRSALGSLFAVMVLGLFMNAGITTAFEDNPWLFVTPFLACSVGTVALYFVSASDQMRHHAQNMVVWSAGTTVLWIIGAVVDDHRVWWWLAAAALDLTGAWSGHWLPGRPFHSDEVPFTPAHMIERSRLFLIIALGETVLTTGSAIATTHIDIATIVAGALAVVTIIFLWALYFGGSDRLISEHASNTGDPLRAARLAINGQVVTAAGLITTAVAFETTIHDPLDETGFTGALLLSGGPMLYMGLQIWYLRALTGRYSRARIGGFVALAVATGVTWALPGVVSLLVIAAIVTVASIRVVVKASDPAQRRPLATKGE